MVEPPRSTSRTSTRSKGKTYLEGIKSLYLVKPESREHSGLDTLLGAAQAAESNRAEQLRRDREALRTGEDAFAFFAKYGSQADTRMFHCNRDTSQPCNPLALVIVPMHQVQPEHFVISEKGVTHVSLGQLSEFVPMSEWARQCHVYETFTTSPFFTFFSRRKCFSHWRRNVRRVIFNLRRQQLCSTCLLAKRQHAEPLMRVRQLCREMEELPMVHFPPGVPHFADFLSVQSSHHLNAEHGTRHEVEVRCHSITRLLAEAAEGLNKFASAAPPVGPSKRLHRQTTTRVEGISDTASLADIMVRSSLVLLVHSAIGDFCRRLQATGSVENRMFSVAADMTVSSVVLRPDGDEVCSGLDALWVDLTRAATWVPTDEPEASTRGLDTRLTVEEILSRCRGFLAAKAHAHTTLARNVSKAAAQAIADYEPFRHIFEFGRDWDEAAFEALRHTQESLTHDITRLRSFEHDLSKFRAGRVIGVIQVDGHALRNSLTSIPSQPLSCMLQAFSSLARPSCATTTQWFQAAIRTLAEQSGNADLDALAGSVRRFWRRQEELERAAANVVEMYSVLHQQRFKLTLEDKVQFDALRASEREFEQRMLEARVLLRQASISLDDVKYLEDSGEVQQRDQVSSCSPGATLRLG